MLSALGVVGLKPELDCDWGEEGGLAVLSELRLRDLKGRMPRRLLSLLPLLGVESLTASGVGLDENVAAVFDCWLCGTSCCEEEGVSSGKAPGMVAGEEKASDDRGDF